MKKWVAIVASSFLGGLLIAVAAEVWGRPARAAPDAASPRVERLRAEVLPEPYQRLKALDRPKKPPGPRDWLAQQDEPGQTYKEWLASDPVRIDAEHQALYMVALGEFSAEEQRIFELTREYLALHFQAPVKVLDPLAATAIPVKARRANPFTGKPQWHTGFILEELLPPLRPADGVTVMALTTMDLYPQPGWNFVFGEASVTERVGVWSLARNGDPKTDFKLVLLRTIKSAAHEAGHMFSVHHCIASECAMNGSNNMQEGDQGPLEPCASCLAKLASATGLDAKARASAVRAFLEREGLTEDAAVVARAEAAIR